MLLWERSARFDSAHKQFHGPLQDRIAVHKEVDVLRAQRYEAGIENKLNRFAQLLLAWFKRN